jgi:hypothetical protein
MPEVGGQMQMSRNRTLTVEQGHFEQEVSYTVSKSLSRAMHEPFLSGRGREATCARAMKIVRCDIATITELCEPAKMLLTEKY